jgi:hypothetical protein
MINPETTTILDTVPVEEGARRKVLLAVQQEYDRGFLEGCTYKEQQILKALRPWAIAQKIVGLVFWAFFIALFCFWIQHR